MNANQHPATPPPAAIPADVHCAQDYETLASRYIAAPTLAYIAGGSGRGVTAAANLASFSDLAIVPRLLRDVSTGHTRRVLGAQPSNIRCCSRRWRTRNSRTQKENSPVRAPRRRRTAASCAAR